MSSHELITLTFGDSAENHVGMEQIGTRVAAGHGFQYDDLISIQSRAIERGVMCEHVQLSEHDLPDAHVLVLRQGVNALISGHGCTQEHMFEEQQTLAYDKKAYMYGRVVNKHARWNLCFDAESREPDYAAAKGRIVGYSEVPLLQELKYQIETLVGPKAADLKVESNYYYDTRRCGIGFHGDSERRKVIGVRIGNASMPLHFQWFRNGLPVGEPKLVPLNAGDIYVMSEKAVGTDWKKKDIYTLRHATGCAKFTTV